MAIQRVSSKWAKTNVLIKSEELRDQIPVTVEWSQDALNQMLNKYGMVYVKPDFGTYGSGVIRVQKSSSGNYSFQVKTKKRAFPSFEQMIVPLQRIISNRPYLIQRGIYLLKYSRRRFDLRVMVQKNDTNEWESTGIIGRLSHPRKIVTNYHSGGTPMSIEKLMGRHLSHADIAAYKTQLCKQGVAIATQLQTKYPRLKEIGVDVAVDTSLKPWILEVNTLPDPYIFRKLQDKRIFRKIRRYCKLYGRL
ncbi:YheC/YheD family protein [Paenibacillus solisilvae]|uniref:YheC/YheD family protein n=1 Tax=Paenibacillus solisilvae TaxID=2486751 RepID=A0ABW0W7C3_9BACL